MPIGRAVTIFELPDDLVVETLFVSQLPRNWSSYPSPIELAERGTTWIESCVTIALRVPSLVTPGGEGWNYLFNPAHPNFSKVHIVEVLPFQFDIRLYKRQRFNRMEPVRLICIAIRATLDRDEN